jgi:hypothetical protein
VSGTISLSAATIAAAMNGRLVAGDDDRYVTGFSSDSRTLATGAVEIITQGRRGAVHPRVSPDGSMLAVTIVDSYSRVWLLRLPR